MSRVDVSVPWLHYPPKVSVACYSAEADDLESPSYALLAPLASGMPLLTEGRVTED